MKSVDRFFVFPSIVLKNTSQERLGEEESRNPEVWWSTLINPFLHEFESFNEIIDPTTKWFQAGICIRVPDFRDFIIEHAVENKLKILTHHHKPIDCFVNINQSRSNSIQKLIESKKFLLKHSVHRLFVFHRMFLCNLECIERLRQFSKDFFNFTFDDLLSGSSSTFNISGQQRQNSLTN